MPLSYTHPLLNQGNINIFSNFGQFLRVPYQKDKNKTIAKTSLSYMSLSIIGLYVMNRDSFTIKVSQMMSLNESER